MKYLESAQVGNCQLVVLAETGKFALSEQASISYFIDGEEVIEWASLNPKLQQYFSAIAVILCREKKLIKWSY